jgi:hypothetical protein
MISCAIIVRVGLNHIYTVYIWYFWQGNHQMYGHIRCIYTVLANPNHNHCTLPERGVGTGRTMCISNGSFTKIIGKKPQTYYGHIWCINV